MLEYSRNRKEAENYGGVAGGVWREFLTGLGWVWNQSEVALQVFKRVHDTLRTSGVAKGCKPVHAVLDRLDIMR